MSEQNGGTADWLEVVFEFQVHEKVEALKVLPCHNREHCEAEALDCLSSEASERILLVTSDFAAHVLTWDQNRKQFRTIACTVLSAKPHGDSPSDLPRHNGCTVSDPVIVEQSAGGALRSVLAGAFYNGILHIIGYPARFPIGGVEELDCVAVPFSQLAETPMGVRTTEQLLNVISMAFLPLPGGTNEEGRPLLAVLYESQGYLEQAVHLHCVAVDEPGGQLLPGPWVLRNVHPTTSLLRTFRSADPSVPSGVLAVSSRSCQLFTEASAGPVMSVEMEGIPTAMVELRPGSWIIGDSTGALWEVQPGGVPPARVSAAAAGRGEGGGSGSDGAGDPRLSAAETLLCLPIEDGTPGSGAGCIVFLGSHTGPSQVLRPAMSGSDPWQLLEPALEEGLSPINDAVLFEHPPGTGEQHLAVCGGSGHTGRFAIASLAAERSVLAEAGGCLPGAPRVFSVEAASGIGGPPGALLVLSSDSPESTAAMSFEDGCLAPCALPGLDEDSATLLVCSTDAGWIVQVTPREAAVLGRASGRRSSWSPPASRLTQACARGGRLLLASGSALHDLLVDEDSGKLLHVQSAELSRQISALAQLSLRSPGGQSLRAAAVGCWQDDCVSLLQAGELGGGPVASAALPQGQARSLLGRELTPGKTHLIAGTSCGLVAVYTVEAGQGDSIRLQLSCSVWAGNTPVDLVPLSLPGSRKPATREAAYALSSQDLLLRGGADGRVAALRVVGEGQAVSLARRAAGCGPLWPDARLGGPRRAPPPRAARRQPAPPVALVLDDSTPVSLAYHKASQCFVLACVDGDGSGAASLRLVRRDPLEQVALVQLQPNHKPLSVLSAVLPCTSSDRAKEQAYPADVSADKEFLLVLSCIVKADGSGATVAGGLLSAFDITRAAEEAAGSNRLDVVLHATRPTPFVCQCMAAAQLQPPQGGRRGEPALLLGGEEGVLLMQVFVDDLAAGGPEAVDTVVSLLRSAAVSPSTPAEERGEDGTADGDAEAGGQQRTGDEPPMPPPEDRWEVWRQRMELELLDSCCSSAVTYLSVSGDTAMAGEFLGNVKLFKVGAGGSCALKPLAKETLPAFPSAGCLLSPGSCFASLQPYGFALMEPPPGSALEDCAEDSLRRSARSPEERRASDRQPGTMPASAEDLPRLSVRTLCRKPQIVSKMCSGRLGTVIDIAEGPSGPVEAVRGDAIAAVYVTACGAVGIVQTLQSPDSEPLLRLQHAIHQASERLAPPWDATTHRHEHLWRWRLSDLIGSGRDCGCEVESAESEEDDHETQSSCIDGDLLALMMELDADEFSTLVKEVFDSGTGVHSETTKHQTLWEEAFEIAACTNDKIANGNFT
eukprot:CAMPEP_0177592478 /NCGR_PEP_ID=MMETSP0419_2-20121207/8584_1 /TAXON_ID=582737 /ORGANISM="Tetraselmis sp., Strain GSL018" /LENGTH=1340 /DNA_ID=CAMNT_0019083353 /DNA_START=244 /DNA_END=4267 /DNA_ORIENTATION=+